MSLPVRLSGLSLDESKMPARPSEDSLGNASKGLSGFLAGIQDPIKSSPRRTFSLQEPAKKDEIEKVQSLISESVVTTMRQSFNRHENGNGIWYPADYCKYLKEKLDVDMNPSYLTGYADEEFFQKTERFTFRLKEGKKAADAILSFLKGPTVADCGNATTACFYKAILDLIGEEKFNRLFDASSGFPLTISQSGITDEESPISFLADLTAASKEKSEGVLGRRPLRVGDECHFGGVMWYANKHPEGFGGGWNVIYMGDDPKGNQLFGCHGFENFLTEQEIIDRCIERYNRERTPQDESFIKKAKTPLFHDVKKNRFLKECYVISPEKAKKDLKKYVRGFQSDSARNLDARLLAKLCRSKNVLQFMKDRQIAVLKRALFD